MWKEYADSIGVGVQSLTKQQKIQAEVNGILNETRFQTGDAAKVATTYAGQVAMLSFNFQQLKVAVGNAIMPIAKAVLPVINTVISALTTLANVFAQVTSLLFGKSYEPLASAQKGIAASGAAAADSTQDLADAAAGAGSASKKAAKDMKGILAGFDDLNVLASQTADSVGSAAGGVGELGSAAGGALDLSGVDTGGELFGNVTVNPEIAAFIERLKTALEPTIEALGRLWAELQRLGEFAWQGLEGFYNNFLRPIGEWVLGEDGLPRFIHLVADTMENINWERLVSSFNGLWEQLAKIATFTGDALIDFVEYFLKPLSEWTMNEAIPRLVDALTEGLAQVNWEAIRQGLIELWKALEPFAENVGEGLLWLWENVLVPLGVWVLNEAVPTFLNLLAAAITAVNAVIEALKPLADWLWKNFLEPLAQWTGGVIITVLEGLTEVLQKISGWIQDNQGLVQAMAVTVGLFFAAWKGVELAEFVINAGGAVSIIHKMIDAIKAATVAKIADKIETLQIVALYAKDFIVSLAKSISNLAKETAAWVASTAAKVANKVAQIAMTAATAAWNAICAAATAVTTAFGAAVAFLTSPVGLVVAAIAALIAIVVLLVTHWDVVKEAAIACWEKIKEVWAAVSEWFSTNVIQPLMEFFSGLWDGIKEAASAAWEGVSTAWNAAGEWFNTNIIQPVQKFFSDLWTGVQKAAQDAWTGISNIWNVVSGWFSANIIQPVAGFFQGLWNGISKAAGEAWKNITDVFGKAASWFKSTIIDPVTNGFKGFFNGLIGFAEGFVNFFIRGINKLIGALNGLSFSAPDWVPFIGGKKFGVNIPTASELRLPRLAGGAVIPPNSQFAAILGDQRSGYNVEAPVSMIEQAVARGLAAAGGGGGDITVDFTINLDSREIYRGQKRVSRQIGKSLVGGLA